MYNIYTRVSDTGYGAGRGNVQVADWKKKLWTHY